MTENTTNLMGMSLPEMEDFFVRRGEEKFRGRQVFRWLYQRGVSSFVAMTDLSVELRERLESDAAIQKNKILKIQKSHESEAQATQKILFELSDGQKVESVLIPDDGRRTVCLSSQVGCAVDCEFCATGWMGFRRHMSAGEIVDQLIAMRQIDPHISNIVFMGMGEPFLNYDNVLRAAEIIAHPDGLGMSPKHITLSTSGIIPRIVEYADGRHPYHLAISLNATTDDVRRRIMPITRKYPLEELLKAVEHYIRTSGRPVTLEYVLMKDINDTEDDARRLIKLSARLHGAKINIIPYNPIEGPRLERPSDERIAWFMKRVSSVDGPLTLRRSRGRDIAAACGQLAVKSDDVYSKRGGEYAQP